MWHLLMHTHTHTHTLTHLTLIRIFNHTRETFKHTAAIESTNILKLKLPKTDITHTNTCTWQFIKAFEYITVRCHMRISQHIAMTTFVKMIFAAGIETRSSYFFIFSSCESNRFRFRWKPLQFASLDDHSCVCLTSYWRDCKPKAVRKIHHTTKCVQRS